MRVRAALSALTVALGGCSAAAAEARGAAGGSRAGAAGALGNVNVTNKLKQLRTEITHQVAQMAAQKEAVAASGNRHQADQPPADAKGKELFKKSLARGWFMEQLHASEDSALWLQGELHSAADRVDSAFLKLTQAEKKAVSDEAFVKDRARHAASAKVQKFEDQERLLGKMVARMTKADQDLQDREDKALADLSQGRARNSELLAEHEGLAGASSAEARTLEQLRTVSLQEAAQIEDDKEEMEAMRQHGNKQVGDVLEQIAEIRRQAAANTTANEETVRELRGQANRDSNSTGDVIQEKIDATNNRARDAEEQQAEAMLAVRQAADEQRDLEGQLAQVRAEVASLRRAKEAMEAEQQELQDAVKREQEDGKRAHVILECADLQRDAADADGEMARLQHKLERASDVRRTTSRINGDLRQDFAKLKQRLAGVLGSDNNAALGMHEEIDRLHHELETGKSLAPADIGVSTALPLTDGKVGDKAATNGGDGDVAAAGHEDDSAVAVADVGDGDAAAVEGDGDAAAAGHKGDSVAAEGDGDAPAADSTAAVAAMVNNDIVAVEGDGDAAAVGHEGDSARDSAVTVADMGDVGAVAAEGDDDTTAAGHEGDSAAALTALGDGDAAAVAGDRVAAAAAGGDDSADARLEAQEQQALARAAAEGEEFGDADEQALLQAP